MRLAAIITFWSISAIGLLIGSWFIHVGTKKRRNGERISIRAFDRVDARHQTGGELIGTGIVTVLCGVIIAFMLLVFF
jgi:hypothetical protein